MDRRQKKTRISIFNALTELLSRKHFSQITVSEIIEKADVGRATFYSHFETKDFLLKELCEELFCHIFDALHPDGKHHRHIFDCDAPPSVMLHLLEHLKNNDNNILTLLACENNELFLRYFKANLKTLIQQQPKLFPVPEGLPEGYWINHVSSSFAETVKWWVGNGMKETAEEISDYFLAAIY